MYFVQKNTFTLIWGTRHRRVHLERIYSDPITHGSHQVKLNRFFVYLFNFFCLISFSLGRCESAYSLIWLLKAAFNFILLLPSISKLTIWLNNNNKSREEKSTFSLIPLDSIKFKYWHRLCHAVLSYWIDRFEYIITSSDYLNTEQRNYWKKAKILRWFFLYWYMAKIVLLTRQDNLPVCEAKEPSLRQ